MSFIEEIVSVFGGEDVPPAFRVMLFGDRAAYIEGVRAIISYSQEKMELTVKNGKIKITGEGLYIKKYCAEDIAVCEKIKAVEKV